MQKGQELIYALNNRANHYDKIRLRGAFFHHKDGYYPIKLLILPTNEHFESKILDYGELLLVDQVSSVSEISSLVMKFGNLHEFEISQHRIVIPRGYFSDLEEDQTKISQEFGGYASLSDYERKLLKYTRSYPKSTFRQWPTKTYLFQCRVESDFNNAYSKKSSNPLPVISGLPLLPDYYSAISWWIGNDLDYLNDNKIIFYLPDFRARITDVVFAKNEFIIKIEPKLTRSEDLRGKYFVSYESLTPDFGDIDFSKSCNIAIKERVQRLYVVLYDINNPISQVDFRDYHLRSSREDELDIEYAESNIEYWLTAGENEGIEFKIEVEERKTDQFVESVGAFLNTDGGRIFIGVDDNGNIKGLDEGQIKKYQQRIPDWIRNWIEPQAQVKIEVVQVREKAIIVVTMPKGTNPPYNYRDHGIYIRAGATDRIATRDELLLLIPDRSLGLSETKLVY